MLQASFEERTAPILRKPENWANEHAILATHLKEGILEEVESLRDSVQIELFVLKKVIGVVPSGGEAPSRLKIPNPLPLIRALYAKELENFL